MRHDETRDNTTNLEATLIEADAFEETREDATTWSECECEDCTVDVVDRSGDSVPDGESFPGMQCADGGVPFHRPYQSESEMAEDVDDDYEDDGQPSEYDEWQDYMGGDEYYDHSENACW
jgi:hypothetical protein